MGAISLSDFVSSLDSRPHIAESIISHLSICDIGSCLRASKDFRRFIVNAIEGNSTLRNDLDECVSRMNVARGLLKAIDRGPMKTPKWDQTSYKQHFGFSADGTLWLSRPSTGGVGYDRNHNLSVYDLESNAEMLTAPQSYKYSRPFVKMLPCQKILVQDRERVRAFSRKEDGKTYDVSSEFEVDEYGCRLDYFCGEDCIFKMDEIKENNQAEAYKLTFSGCDGHLMVDRPLILKNHPWKVLEKVD